MPEVRKLVTILFADVTGSTALGESLDPEDLHALMGRYYAHAQRVVSDYGGTIQKFIGDAVMAVFGLPQAHSNDAERALAAALALREAVASDATLDGRLVLRIGVNTGAVIATTDVSRSDFLVMGGDVMGDAVNVAARLEQTAAPNEILASERTATAAAAAFRFDPARIIEVKGKSHPLRVFPLSAQRPTRQLGRPPLVGRKPDLAMLALLRDRALAERRPQLVSIVAPAGTGKTRLLEEFLARINPKDGFQVATARCLTYGQTLAYWPLRGLLEETLGGEVTTDSVAAIFSAGGHTPDNARRLAELALVALGIEPQSGSGTQSGVERETIFSAWRLLIEALARQAPRIIVFEDLHWASESLLDLVEHVMQPRTEAALLIVATSRPELLDRRPGWGGGRRSFTSIALEPLSEPQTRMLVDRLAKKLPNAVRARIAERSGGNPFFVIELARALEDDAHIVESSPTATLDALPDTVQEAVQERLDALAPRERTALQVAAVAGRAFRPATLQATLNARDLSEIELVLDGLLARDLIMPAGDGEYAFRHILVRDVAYGALARGERIRLHTAVARWLEDFATGRVDEFVELIAYHYLQAAQLARQAAIPLDQPVDFARAVYYLERAGKLAAHAGAIIEARGHLERAIDLGPEVDRPRLYETLGDSAAIGNASVAAYRRALAYWRADEDADSARDPLTGARLMRKLLIAHMRWLGTITERLSAGEMTSLRAEARRLASDAGDEYELWRLRVVDLFWPWWRGETALDEARAQMAVGLDAAAYFEARGDWIAFSEALDAYATRARDVGDYVASSLAARRRLEATTLPVIERADALGELAWTQCDSGDYEGAIATVRAAIIQRQPGDPAIVFGQAPAWASLAACFSGHWAELTDYLAILDETWGELRRDVGIRLLGWGSLAPLYVALAREDKAATDRAAEIVGSFGAAHHGAELRALLEASLRDDPAPLQDLMRSTSDRADVSRGFWYLIMFLSERGLPLAPALINLLSVSRKARAIHVLNHCVQIALALAACDDARLAVAIDDAEAHGLIPHAARMRIVLAQHTGDRTQLERARSILEQLGDRQFLRRLEDVAAALE